MVISVIMRNRAGKWEASTWHYDVRQDGKIRKIWKEKKQIKMFTLISAGSQLSPWFLLLRQFKLEILFQVII